MLVDGFCHKVRTDYMEMCKVLKRYMFGGRKAFPKELHPLGIRKNESLDHQV